MCGFCYQTQNTYKEAICYSVISVMACRGLIALSSQRRFLKLCILIGAVIFCIRTKNQGCRKVSFRKTGNYRLNMSWRL